MDSPTSTGAYYDGALYARLVEPLVAALHDLVADSIPPGSTVLDACSGTGGLAFALASRCKTVVGVDLSPRMVAFAEAERARRDVRNLRFEVGDASRLDGFEDRSFDHATVVMGLHEMPSAVRGRVLPALARVAERVVAVDFAPRLRLNPAGIRNRIVELLAGPRHFAGFRDFMRRGGLPPLIAEAELRAERHGVADAGNLDIYTLVSASPSRA